MTRVADRGASEARAADARPDAGTVHDLVVVGAGAAGMMAAISAGRAAQQHGGRRPSIVLLDGARTIGAKILVAGGGRCNVTHHAVDETAYAGSTRPAIRRVLRRFDVPRTVAFFRELGVTLKREDTGKLFPTTDSARTVLDALRRAVRDAGAVLEHPVRVSAIELVGDAAAEMAESPASAASAASADVAAVADAADDAAHATAPPPGGMRFKLTVEADGRSSVRWARSVIMATGGKSLPKSGSDGHGHVMIRGLGHEVTDRVFPSLVPLLLADGHALRDLSGLSTRAGVEVRGPTGKRLARFEHDLLCTHFGLSGPAALDVSRWWIDAFMDDRDTTMVIDWLPDADADATDAALQASGPGTVLGWVREHVPERLARVLLELAEVDGSTRRGQLTRTARRRLVTTLHEMPVPVTGNRGYKFAEVTAGGVPLRDLHLGTMESRVIPGLYVCGELCDVDGRIGGFNFQWAWASGYVAGGAAAESLVPA